MDFKYKLVVLIVVFIPGIGLFTTCLLNKFLVFRSNKCVMRRFVIFFGIFLFCLNIFAQPVPAFTSENQQSGAKLSSNRLKKMTEDETANRSMSGKLLMAEDTLTLTDFIMSIERVNDNLNSIRDSSKLQFEVVHMSRRIDEISGAINLIRQNTRDRSAVLNVKNLYLYQSLASNLDDENTRVQAHLAKMYNRVYHAKVRLKTVLLDSVFIRLYSQKEFRTAVDAKLIRLDRKFMRADSVAKSNIDSLNSLKVKSSDNSINLSGILSVLDRRLDKARPQLFGQEVNCLWQKSENDAGKNNLKAISILGSEKNAIGYYFSQTSGERTFVIILGVLLFIWLIIRRKLLKIIREKKGSFDFLNLQYLNSHPALSLLVLLLCLMPFFDAYAPTSYVSIEYLLLLTASSLIFIRLRNRVFMFDWLVLVMLFVADALTYFLIEPSILERLCLLSLHTAIIVFSLRFYRRLSNDSPYFKWIKKAVIIGIILSALGLLCNLFGRFSLSGIFGISGIFAVTQAVVLPVFIDTVIEFILLQIQSSRLKKGVNKPFDSAMVIKKIKGPLVIVAILLWLVMLTSNLNIYHAISNQVVDFLTTQRTIGSISYRLISLLWFFVIIWFAHILQQLVSFIFGETGVETDDATIGSKEKHSRLLITRLLVLIGGYLLAIAASGLPIDKLTFVLGALGVGIGMGLQNVVNNFVSGIILIFDGSLQIGDQIEINGQSGKVKEIGLRASRLNTADGAEVIIPNGNILSQNIVNWTYSNDEKRVILRFSLTGKELDANVINDVINGTVTNIPHVNSKKKPVILYSKVTRDTCWLNVRFWSTIDSADNARSAALMQLNAAFSAKNIEFK